MSAITGQTLVSIAGGPDAGTLVARPPPPSRTGAGRTLLEKQPYAGKDLVR